MYAWTAAVMERRTMPIPCRVGGEHGRLPTPVNHVTGVKKKLSPLFQRGGMLIICQR